MDYTNFLEWFLKLEPEVTPCTPPGMALKQNQTNKTKFSYINNNKYIGCGSEEVYGDKWEKYFPQQMFI